MEPPIDPPRPTVLDPTRARPEPWFVGNGTGLTMAVLSLCAIVIVARGVTTVWLIEDAWAWWKSRPAAPSRSQPARVNIVPVPAPPIAADPALANAKVGGNPGTAFTADSYPLESLRLGQQGRTVARLDVAPTGRPTRCVITESSGSKLLDRQTCRIAMTRARFTPARDERGVPVAGQYVLPVRWQIPGE